MKNLQTSGKDSLLIVAAILALTSSLVVVQMLPAFAVTRTWPPYVTCTIKNTGSGSLGGCDPGPGNLRAYSTANAQGVSSVAVYMYGNAFSQSCCHTLTLSAISSSDVHGKLVLNVGDTSNNVAVRVYLDNPSCVRPWECAYQEKTSLIYQKTQTTAGTFTFSGAKTGPDVTYSITTTGNFMVISYADASTAGTQASNADMRNSPNGVFSVRVTETN
ncbi:MAG TPA: hypothetical protein VGQ13_10205 [Nitrososphaera sp.]|jgi:hypothetical protein|nr:hypothetical protein [Nitrososphaera sp.]